ncbi:methylmalonyl-CoA epimerase [Candidatus Geothermarchaeota archaeon ex4572_27]|nr:MAG: methylmalonyl-CoA epimerase [Candidatus Geothermarchaeota archaeon ex4572_27]
MASRVDHIGIAVRDVRKAIDVYRDKLGLKLVKIEEVEAEKVRIAMFKVGETYIELLEPTSPDSALAKFLEKRGEGVHHIALRVDDINKAVEDLRSRGMEFTYEKPRELHDRKIIFIHPKHVHGVLLELVERIKEVEG